MSPVADMGYTYDSMQSSCVLLLSVLQSSTHKCDDVTSSFQFGSSGKLYHIAGHEGPEREYRYSPYSSTLSLTSVLDSG